MSETNQVIPTVKGRPQDDGIGLGSQRGDSAIDVSGGKRRQIGTDHQHAPVPASEQISECVLQPFAETVAALRNQWHLTARQVREFGVGRHRCEEHDRLRDRDLANDVECVQQDCAT